MTRQVYKPLRSTVHVYEVGAEDRVYEATTSDHLGRSQVKAKQLSGPELELLVSEIRYKLWGGGGEPPRHPTRKHCAFYTPTGAKYPEPMTELQTGQAEVTIFKKHGSSGELAYFIPNSEIVQ